MNVHITAVLLFFTVIASAEESYPNAEPSPSPEPSSIENSVESFVEELTRHAEEAAQISAGGGTACVESEVVVDALGWGLTCGGSDSSARSKADRYLADAQANCTNGGGTVVNVRGRFCGGCAFSLAGFWTACGYNFKCRRCVRAHSTTTY